MPRAMRRAYRNAMRLAMHVHTYRRTYVDGGYLQRAAETNVTRTRKTARNPQLQSLIDDLTAERFQRHHGK